MYTYTSPCRISTRAESLRATPARTCKLRPPKSICRPNLKVEGLQITPNSSRKPTQPSISLWSPSISGIPNPRHPSPPQPVSRSPPAAGSSQSPCLPTSADGICSGGSGASSPRPWRAAAAGSSPYYLS
jgi:hypothetical protein